MHVDEVMGHGVFSVEEGGLVPLGYLLPVESHS